MHSGGEDIRTDAERLPLVRAQALVRLAHALASAPPELHAVLQTCADEVLQITRDTCVIVVQRTGTDLLDLGALASPTPTVAELVRAMVSATPPRLGEGFTGRCLALGRAVVAEDLSPERFEQLLAPVYFAQVRHLVPRAVVAVPLLARGEGIGALTLIRHEAATFTADEVAFAETIAAHAALHIANARLVDDLRTTNTALSRTQDELRRTIDDLDAFSSSVSHDLRGPVRAIDALTQIVLEESTLEPEPTALLGRVRANTQRMGRLIDDLLRLARISRLPVSPHAIDLTGMVESVVARTRELHPGHGVAVQVATGLRAHADAGLLRIVLENLIDNAFKFTTGHASPRVAVTAPEGVTFAVCDNGAGFDEAHRARLFQPFQRLHAASEFPGTGIGLATVHRIVDRLGGRITAEGRPSHGARFCVILPHRPDEVG
jgi:signal transduction histidine kinase